MDPKLVFKTHTGTGKIKAPVKNWINLLITTRGSAIISINDNQSILSRGSVLKIEENEKLELIFTKNLNTYLLQFPASLTDDQPEYAYTSKLLKISPVNLLSLEEDIKILQAEMDTPSFYHPCRVRSLLFKVASALELFWTDSESSKLDSIAANPKADPDIVNFLTTVEKLIPRHTIKLDIAFLSETLCMNKEKLQKICKNSTNLSVAHYIQRERLEYSRVLLADPEMTIEKAAFLSGFYDASHLIRSFKKHFDTTPGSFR